MIRNVFSGSRVFHEVMWKNIEYGTVRQTTLYIIIWRMRFACWINKATKVQTQNL